MTRADLTTPVSEPVADPTAAHWLGMTEYALMGNLSTGQCPTCLREIPDNFFMFRPVGLEFWRCLACLARTQHGGALYVAREADSDGGLPELDDESDYAEAPF